MCKTTSERNRKPKPHSNRVAKSNQSQNLWLDMRQTHMHHATSQSLNAFGRENVENLQMCNLRTRIHWSLCPLPKGASTKYRPKVNELCNQLFCDGSRSGDFFFFFIHHKKPHYTASQWWKQRHSKGICRGCRGPPQKLIGPYLIGAANTVFSFF